MAKNFDRQIQEMRDGLYLMSEELDILLRLNGAAGDIEVSTIEIEDIDDENAGRIAATIYDMWKKGKVDVVPWPEVKQRLQMLETITVAHLSEAHNDANNSWISGEEMRRMMAERGVNVAN